VILTLSASGVRIADPVMGPPLMGGFGVACTAIEALTMNLVRFTAAASSSTAASSPSSRGPLPVRACREASLSLRRARNRVVDRDVRRPCFRDARAGRGNLGALDDDGRCREFREWWNEQRSAVDVDRGYEASSAFDQSL
jgi:hypothetical protein